MRFPRWTVPILLRLLSLTSLGSASGGDQRVAVGFSLSTIPATNTNTDTPESPAETLSQPRPVDDFSLDLNFFVQVANQELKVPIMPLHLLGKKSWNVYNQDNIERVKRDEAIAKAIEEAKEQRMQEADAERRMQILRGEIPTPLQIEDKPDDGAQERHSYGSGRERKRRKQAGENDTDFEMRIASEQTSVSNTDKQIVLRKPIEAPLLDHSGHIDLFPQERSTKSAEKNAEAEKESARKKKEYEDQYTMRFSNAAGFRQGLDKPWYSKPTGTKDAAEEDTPGKDVWGNEDPRRKEREAARTVSSDPLAMMRQGAAQARQVEKERKQWREEKEKELRELVKAENRRKRHKRRHDDDSDDEDLKSFRLDQDESHSSRRHDEERDRKHRHKRRESHRSSHRDEGSKYRHKHRHRHRD